MAQPVQDDSRRYLTDMVNLTMMLNAVILRNDVERITPSLNKGKEQYFDLIHRRLSINFSPEDAAVAFWMLDILQDQLATLARLQHETPFLPEARDRSEPGAAALDG